MDLNTYIFGARLVYWLYLLLAVAFGGGIVLYWSREWIRKTVYTLKSPEKLIIVNIIYPGGMFRRFYRLIPTSKQFMLDGILYNYSDSAIMRNNDFYARGIDENPESLKVSINGKDYHIDNKKLLKLRWEKWPEIWYREGNPLPIDWEHSDHTILKYNSDDLNRFIKSNLLQQLYTSMEGGGLLAVILVLVIITLLCVMGVIGIESGLIHVAKNVTGVPS